MSSHPTFVSKFGLFVLIAFVWELNRKLEIMLPVATRHRSVDAEALIGLSKERFDDVREDEDPGGFGSVPHSGWWVLGTT